jgi:hypothetical protein
MTKLRPCHVLPVTFCDSEYNIHSLFLSDPLDGAVASMGYTIVN